MPTTLLWNSAAYNLLFYEYRGNVKFLLFPTELCDKPPFIPA